MENKKRKKSGGHKGNNGLKGKPSNNKGKRREAKVPRRSVLDVEILASKDEAEENSDVEEQLDHAPITAHMYRSAFIKQWCAKLKTFMVLEEGILHDLLGHDYRETACIITISEAPTCHTVDHWRKNVFVKGRRYPVPEVKRPADRTVRDYHFWMYNSGNFTRAQLAQMSSPKANRDAVDAVGGSHVCGGRCLNHARPEPNSINQQRKAHHTKMKAALEQNSLVAYRQIREECKHEPKCFLNPERLGLTQALIKANQAEYDKIRFTYQ